MTIRRRSSFVIPAKAGIHPSAIVPAEAWTPAFAGVTVEWRGGAVSAAKA
jgi:hypothetical protein